MAYQMRLLSDMIGGPNDGPSNSHSGSKRDSFVGPPSEETSLVHARCAANSAAFWEKQSAIQESIRLSITNLYQRINEEAKELFEYQAREDDKVKKFLSDLDSHLSTLGDEVETRRNDGNVNGNIYSGLLPGQWHQSEDCPFPLAELPHYSFRMRAPAVYPRMGAFEPNDSDAGAYDTVAEQILRIRSEVIYSWSRKREANFSSLLDDLVRSFAVGTTLAGSRAFQKAQKTFGPFREMACLLPDALSQDLEDAMSSDTDDSFQGSTGSSSVHPVGDADMLREKAAKVMAEKIAYAQQRAASTSDRNARFHASQKSASNLELPPDLLERYHRMTSNPELDSSSAKSKEVHLASEAPCSLTYPVQRHGDADSQREQRGWRHLAHNDFYPNTDSKVSLHDHSEFPMHDTFQDTQRTLHRPANGQNDILAFRAALSVDEDGIFSRLLTSVGALKTAHGAVKELEVKRIRQELASLANSTRESSFRASETFLSKLISTDPTSYHSIDLKSKLFKRLNTATSRRPQSSLAVEVSSVGPPRSIVIHLGPEQMDEATVRRMLKDAATNKKGTIFRTNAIRNGFAHAFKRKQVQVLVESACRQVRVDDTSKPHKRRASMVSLEGGSILKRTGKFVRQNNGEFDITEPWVRNSKWKPGNNYLPPRTVFDIALDELYGTEATHSPPGGHERPSEQLRDGILASIYGYQDRDTRSRAKAQYLTKSKEYNSKYTEALRRRREWVRQGGAFSNYPNNN
jgi:hypothetical protein